MRINTAAPSRDNIATMTILITGTAGFIGNNLALRLLGQGHEVIGVDSVTPYYDVNLKRDRLKRAAEYGEQFTPYEFMLEDMDKLADVFERHKPKRVIHLAAQAGVRYSLENPRAYVDTNVIGSFNVIEMCKQHEVEHLLLASTSSAYGANPSVKFNELDKAPYPLTIYAATKLASELIAHSHSQLFGVPTTALRFFTVYGPWGRPDMALFLFTEAMLKNEAINIFNHGEMIRDFTYVDDLTQGIALLMDTPPELGKPVSEIDSLSPVAPYRLVNIGNSSPIELMAFIREIEKNLGFEAKKNFMDMQAGDIKKTYAANDLLLQLTGYEPKVSVEEGIKNFVSWYRDYYNK